MISLKNITKSFKLGENEIEILHGINLEIKKGEFIAIIGQSGSGKSTLMNILGCLAQVVGSTCWMAKIYQNLIATHLLSLEGINLALSFKDITCLAR